MSDYSFDDDEERVPWQQSDFYQKYITPMDKSTNKHYAHYLTQFESDKMIMNKRRIVQEMKSCMALYAFLNDHHRDHCKNTQDERRLCSDCLNKFAVSAERHMNEALDACFERWHENEESLKWPDEADKRLDEWTNDHCLFASIREEMQNETNEEKSEAPRETAPTSPTPPREQSPQSTKPRQANPPSIILTHVVDANLFDIEQSYFEKTWRSWTEFVFAGHEIPKKFLFENVDTIVPVGNNVTISFKERPKKRLLDFFAQRLKGNRSCQVKVYSQSYYTHQREENLFSSFKLQQQSPKTPKQSRSSSPPKRFPSLKQPSPITISNFSRTPHYSQSPFGHPSIFNSGCGPSYYPSFSNNQPNFTSQSQYVSQEQLLQIQRQLDFLTLHLVRSQSWNAT